MSNILKIKMLSSSASLPVRATDGSAGYDLACDMDFILQPNERRLIGTGLAISLPTGTWGEIKSRSGLAVDNGVDIKAGVIDEDYSKEVKVLMSNNGNRPLRCKRGDRIAQMVIQAYLAPSISVVNELEETGRNGGFGSTGV